MPKQTFINLPEEKKKIIIDAATNEFANHPYHQASLSNIVEQAGIAKGSMYQYFENKKDLFMYLLDLAGQEKLKYIQDQGLDFQGDFFVSLQKALLAGTRFNLEHPRLAQVVMNAMDASGEDFLVEISSRTKTMAHRFMMEIIMQAQEGGGVRRDIDPNLAAYLMNAILGEGLVDYLLAPFGKTKRDYLTDSRILRELKDDQIREAISGIIKIVKNGLEGEK